MADTVTVNSFEMELKELTAKYKVRKLLFAYACTSGENETTENVHVVTRIPAHTEDAIPSNADNLINVLFEAYQKWLTENPGVTTKEIDFNAKLLPEYSILDTWLDHLELTPYIHNRLEAQGICKIRTLVKYSTKRLRKVYGIGDKSIEIIREKLSHCGLTLRND